MHFLQQAPWEKLQESLGRTLVRRSGQGWEYRAYLERGKFNSRLYCPYGPVIDATVASPAEALREAIESLRAEAKILGAAFLRVEPTGKDFGATELESLGLRRVKRKQPEHTQVLDLDRPLDEVLKDMRKTLRNLHRNYHKKGLTIEWSSDPQDVEHLIRLLGEVSDRTGMHAHDADYLRANARALMPGGSAKIYLVHHESEPEPIAASLVFDDAEARYYAHAAADTAHRKLSPGSVIVTQMIADAHAAGQKRFDLYGVVPPDVTDHAWSGFSAFKRSFGGEQVDYNGTWELPVKRVSYAIYSLARRVLGDN